MVSNSKVTCIDETSVIVAAIQMVTGVDYSENLAIARKLVQQAASSGAEIVLLPEYFAFMGDKETDKLSLVEQHGEGTTQSFLANLARQNRIWLVGGTHCIASPSAERPYGRCYVYSPLGECITWYDKIHLFDVSVADNKRDYCESRYCSPGEKVVAFDSPWGKIGLAVCYDLRFPELFRELALQDVKLVMLPAAFTAKTGQAHWDVLIKARAIENQVFFVAAGQGGIHQNGRETWGHSCIVSPWGELLNSQASGTGVVFAKLDLKALKELRQTFPVLSHRKL